MKIPFFKKLTFKVFTVLILVLSLSFSVSYFITLQYTNKIINKYITSDFNNAINTSENFINLIGETSKLWAKHVIINNKFYNKIASNNLENIDDTLKIEKDSISADVIVLLDNNGKILSEIGSEYEKGDSLNLHDIVKETFLSKLSVTKVSREKESFIIYSSSMIEKNGAYQGMVLVGYFINDTLLKNIKINSNIEVALVGNSAVMSSTQWGTSKQIDILPLEYIKYLTLLKNPNTFQRINYNGNNFIVSAKKLRNLESSVTGSILVGYKTNEIDTMRNNIFYKTLLWFTTIFIIVLLLLLYLANKILVSISTLTNHTRLVMDGDLNNKVDIKTNDEFELLANNFNNMVSSIKLNKSQLEKSSNLLESEVKRQTKELQKNFDIISEYVIFSKTDLDGIITEVSDSFCKISKYTREELIGKNHSIVRHSDTKDITYEEMWGTLHLGKVWQGEIKNINKDGEYYWIDTTISPEYDKNGEVKSYLAIRHDITDKKNFDEQHIQLMESEKLASMGEMIGNIAHQWRQPLSVISTSATGMLLQKEHNILSDKQFQDNCEMINENAQYLSQTIDDFRNFIKGEHIKSVFLISNTIKVFSSLMAANIKGHHIDVIYDIDENIKVAGYENELIQCLVNIFNNAKDALIETNTKNKLLFITIKQINNTNISIKIKDNAGGIPLNILPKIFEPYFTTKHQSQGTGLGLHMTYNLIVDGMNGTIEVNNNSYEYKGDKYIGAEFIINLSTE